MSIGNPMHPAVLGLLQARRDDNRWRIRAGIVLPDDCRAVLPLGIGDYGEGGFHIDKLPRSGSDPKMKYRNAPAAAIKVSAAHTPMNP